MGFVIYLFIFFNSSEYQQQNCLKGHLRGVPANAQGSFLSLIKLLLLLIGYNTNRVLEKKKPQHSHKPNS